MPVQALLLWGGPLMTALIHPSRHSLFMPRSDVYDCKPVGSRAGMYCKRDA